MVAQIYRSLGTAQMFLGTKTRAMTRARDLLCGSDNIMGPIFQN